MNMQSPLFFESAEEVLGHIVSALGGAKVVGARMRPDLSPDAAGRWLKDTLNDGRREALHPAQVIWLLKAGHEAGQHDAMRWIAGECGYTTPDPISPPDELAELQRQFIQSTKLQQQQISRMEALAVTLDWRTRREAKSA